MISAAVLPAARARVSAAERLARAEQLLSSRSLAAAWHAFNQAEAAGADPNRCSAGRWDVAMLGGSFEDAWRESDHIRSRSAFDPHRFWQGEPIEGRKVIVRSLHGLGDAVHMFRYAPLLRARAAQVIYEVPPRLVPLARCFHAVEHVITWGEHAPASPPDWDVQVEITELPYLFRTSADQLPIATTYVHLPQHAVQSAAISMGPKDRPRVGLVWASGDWNPERNVPLPLLAALLSNHDLEFWNLQGTGSAPDAAALPLRYSRELSDGLLPFAALIANMDLVITPDTLAAHLAGALGKPAWVMLQHAADWRWMTARDDSPWYPSVQLFRQPVPGDWESVINRLRLKLRQFHR